jgi:uncharacterized BrkB/YihY/UPF0761 family membrane protein
MEEKKPISHFVAGLILGAVMCVYSIALNFTGNGQNKALGWVGYLIFAVLLIVFIGMYGKSKDNYVTFGNLFSYGFKATAIATLLIILFIVVFFLLFPEYKEKILDTMQKAMEDQGKLTDDQIEKFVSGFRNNFLLFVGGGALFFYLLCGAIASLIGAAVTKKKPVNPISQMSM